MPYGIRSLHWPRFAALAAFLGVLFFLESASFVPQLAPLANPDEPLFARVSQHSMLSVQFYAGVRPFTVPLLYKLTGRDRELMVTAQSVVSVVAWFVAGMGLAGCLGTPLAKVASLVLVCAVSLSIPINLWDAVIRSDSLSLSLLALTLGLSLFQLRALRSGASARYLLLPWFVACLMFVATRDNVTYLLATALIGYGLYLVPGSRTTSDGSPTPGRVGLLVPMVLLLVLVGFGRWSGMTSLRWHVNLTNVILHRVIPYPAIYEDWARRYDFPRNDVFERFSGQYSWSQTATGQRVDLRLRTDPALQDVQTWLMTKGVSSYQRYLLIDNPVRSMRQVTMPFVRAMHLPTLYAARMLEFSAWNQGLTRWVYPALPAWMVVPFWIGAILVGALIAWRIPRLRLAGGVAVWLMLNAWFQAFVGYHADAAAVGRHLLTATVLYRLGLLVTLLALIDTAAAWIGGHIVRNRTGLLHGAMARQGEPPG